MPDSRPPTPKKFLTNQGENTPSKRLAKILPLTQDFDCLVGHLFISGHVVGGLRPGEFFHFLPLSASKNDTLKLKTFKINQ